MARTHTVSWFNPNTGEIITNRSIWTNIPGFVSIGCKKISESLTSLKDKKDRIKVYYAWNNGLDFSKLNSKLRHKMRKIGLRPINVRFIDFEDFIDKQKERILLLKDKNRKKQLIKKDLNGEFTSYFF